jgi:hypothetical protein
MSGITAKGKSKGHDHEYGDAILLNVNYYRPALCGWLIELTSDYETRNIDDMNMRYQLFPFKYAELDGKISYYCIKSCLKFTEFAKGKNWDYDFKTIEINESTI